MSPHNVDGGTPMNKNNLAESFWMYLFISGLVAISLCSLTSRFDMGLLGANWIMLVYCALCLRDLMMR